jgi:hypothetical protein
MGQRWQLQSHFCLVRKGPGQASRWHASLLWSNVPSAWQMYAWDLGWSAPGMPVDVYPFLHVAVHTTLPS